MLLPIFCSISALQRNVHPPRQPSLSFNQPSSFSYSISDRFLFYFHVNQQQTYPPHSKFRLLRNDQVLSLGFISFFHCFHLTRSKMTLLCLLYSNSILLIKMYIACIYSLTATSKEETELAAGPCFNSRISLVDFEFQRIRHSILASLQQSQCLCAFHRDHS